MVIIRPLLNFTAELASLNKMWTKIGEKWKDVYGFIHEVVAEPNDESECYLVRMIEPIQTRPLKQKNQPIGWVKIP